MSSIGRVLTAMVTPFQENMSLDYQQSRNLASNLITSGSDGLVVSGTTGESPTLTTDEKLRLFQEIRDELGTSGQVIAGVGNYSTNESIDLAKEAENIGVDGLLLVVPYYNKPPQEGLYQHFKAIASSTNLPCILYNVPSRTITNLESTTTTRLSEIDNIVGIKEASGDLAQIARIHASTNADFKIWSGNDSDTYPVVSLGGYGVVSVASHLVGAQIKEMIQLTLNEDIASAQKKHLELMPLFTGLFWMSNPIPVKYALNKVGFRVGSTRLPLTGMDEDLARKLDEVLAACAIDLKTP